jgi:hypothetical protein
MNGGLRQGNQARCFLWLLGVGVFGGLGCSFSPKKPCSLGGQAAWETLPSTGIGRKSCSQKKAESGEWVNDGPLGDL